MPKAPKITTLKPTIQTLDTRQGSTMATERIRGRALAKIRERIMLRDEYTCQVCGRVTAEGEVDHVQPLHLGGAESDENRQYICKEPCHKDKTEREEKERGQ